MTNYFQIGFATGFLIAVIVLFISAIVAKKKGKTADYDERQILARNSAFKTAYFTLMIYCAVCALLSILEISWAMVFVQMFLGIFISVSVFSVICILKDAYTTINKTSTPSLIIFAVAALSNGFVAFDKIAFDGRSIVTNGMLNEVSLQLFTSVFFAVLFAVMLIKRVKDKKEIEE